MKLYPAEMVSSFCVDDERKRLIFWRIINGMSFEEIAARLHIPMKKAVDTYYNTLKKLRKEMRHG